jgi:hypothetical protein
MPYDRFARAAQALGHDPQALADLFGVEWQHAALRLAMLNKPGHEGVPFFLVELDGAGNVVRRMDGAGFPLRRRAADARCGACTRPLPAPAKRSRNGWNCPTGNGSFRWRARWTWRPGQACPRFAGLWRWSARRTRRRAWPLRAASIRKARLRHRSA